MWIEDVARGENGQIEKQENGQRRIHTAFEEAGRQGLSLQMVCTTAEVSLSCRETMPVSSVFSSTMIR